MPRRVKIDSKSLYEFDADDSDEDNNTVYNLKSAKSSGDFFLITFDQLKLLKVAVKLCQVISCL